MFRVEWKIECGNKLLICVAEASDLIKALRIQKKDNGLYDVFIKIHDEIDLQDQRHGSFNYEFIKSFYTKAGNNVGRGNVFQCSWLLNTMEVIDKSAQVISALLETIDEFVPFNKEQKPQISDFLGITQQQTLEPKSQVLSSSIVSRLRLFSEPRNLPSNTISIKGLDPADVLMALYDRAAPTRHFKPDFVFDITEAKLQLSKTKSLDYINGKALKVDLSGDTINVQQYNRDNYGQNAAQEALATLLEKSKNNLRM